jgi:hypothetical protein
VNRLFAFSLVLALLFVGAPVAAGAATRTTPVSYGTSCIDGNNNGVCGESADTPLAQALDANGMYLDGQHGSHSGLVLQGGVHLPDFVYLQVTKNIVISGSVSESGEDIGGSIETLHGNIAIAPATNFALTTSLDITAYDAASTIDVGAGTKAKVSGDTVDFTYHSYGALQVEANQNYTISGGGYTDVNFYGMQGLTVAPGQSFTGPNHGSYLMAGGSDLTLDHVKWKAGYVLINVFGSDAHPGARNLVIRDSTLNQIYKNGNMKVYADTDRDNGALGTILVDHSTLTAKDFDGGIFNPLATCIASTAPSWACQ